MGKLSIYFTVLLTVLCVTSALAKTPPPKEYTGAWSRTAVVVPEPVGRGCIIPVPAAATNEYLTRSVSPNRVALYTLPIQLKITNSGTVSVTVCATQDPAAVISRTGIFTVDADSYYAAGAGLCAVVPPGTVDFLGVFDDSFKTKGASSPVAGARRGTCSTSFAPCHASAECTASGGVTCATGTPPQTTYVSVVNPAGSGADGQVVVCEVE